MNFSHSLVKMKENGTEFIESKLKSTPIAMVAPELKQNAEADTEISKTCAVLGCDDSKNLNSDEFFRFPEDPHFREIWTNLTGRNNWMSTDYSYICIQHFSVDCFTCDADNQMVLVDKAVPSLKLPKHVLEVEYIEEDTLDNEDEDYDMDGDTDYDGDNEAESHRHVNGDPHVTSSKPKQKVDNIELLKLFTEVQMMQRQAVGLKDKLRYNMKIHNRQGRFLNRLNQIIEMKKDVLSQKRKKKARILLSLQDKIKDDTNGLVMAMPSRHTDDLKNFALSIYKYSPQAYIYLRNTLRTLLPSTEVMDNWLSAGFQPKNVISSSNLIKVSTEQTDSELSCKIALR
ncbi:THAP domain-containing protein 1-like [Pectinophora gossypiella]|uniref:THAP-type domain-containing protein n=1 Tax=Pectinophora gossypiella TaxID=13191 RepID=A0A1E1VYZ7_PECGO|nr:THAP domain-containing protein 1-like [Pectinophora gossypiella]